MTTVDTIVKAIEARRSLDFAYHGFKRVVSPYACGLNGSNELKMLAMQTDGGSTSGVTHKLRFFSVADIQAPVEADAAYEPADAAAIEPSLKEFMKFYAKC